MFSVTLPIAFQLLRLNISLNMLRTGGGIEGCGYAKSWRPFNADNVVHDIICSGYVFVYLLYSTTV